MFAWVLLKRATFCGNNCENVGIILRIIGGFKKEFLERIIGEFKSIIDLSLVTKLSNSEDREQLGIEIPGMYNLAGMQ